MNFDQTSRAIILELRRNLLFRRHPGILRQDRDVERKSEGGRPRHFFQKLTELFRGLDRVESV